MTSFRVPQNAGDFLIDRRPLSFSRRILLREVRCLASVSYLLAYLTFRRLMSTIVDVPQR